jgi:hypothetical protein
MPKHPTVEIPNIGPMDHAWDALGEWNLDLEVPFHHETVAGRLRVANWHEASLELDPWAAAAVGLPDQVALERVSRVHLTDAGGGALQWVYLSTEDRWTVQATLWPGSLHLFAQDEGDPNEPQYRAVATRSRDYYWRKYGGRVGKEEGRNGGE